MVFSVVLLLSGLMACVLGLPSNMAGDEKGKCPKYNYCQGRYFPSKFQTGGRTVMCDQAPLLKDNCCLPYSEHLVCYNIRVDGQYLNFNPDNYMESTDFSDLCNAMVAAVDRSPGTSNSVRHGEEGGFLIWRYGSWALNDEKGTKHVKHIACSVLPEAEQGQN